MEEKKEEKQQKQQKQIELSAKGLMKKENFVVLLLIGILLLVVAWPVSGKKNSEREIKSGITDSEADILDLSSDSSVSTEEASGKLTEADRKMLQYAAQMEETLEELLSTMEGAGLVKVMITLKTSGETVIEKDASGERNATTEVDSEGGSRNATQITNREETVYAQQGSSVSSPYVKQVIAPQIEGVVVSAQGGNDKTVIKNITEAIQALFGVEVHKIKVIKMISN